MSTTTADPIAPEVMGYWNNDVARRIVADIRAAWARRADRRAYQDLLTRDDGVFRDIGVTRGDVRQALADCR